MQKKSYKERKEWIGWVGFTPSFQKVSPTYKLSSDCKSCESICLETLSPMASSLPFKCQLTLTALICMAFACCNSEGDPEYIVDQALECFNNHYVYSSCQESCRLSAEGTIAVPPEAVDEYCTGPCFAETKLVLKCIDGILYNFRFYNGASIRDVSYTLATACGHTDKRGDFDVLGNIGAEGYGDYDGHGNKLAASSTLLTMLSCVMLLLG